MHIVHAGAEIRDRRFGLLDEVPEGLELNLVGRLLRDAGEDALVLVEDVLALFAAIFDDPLEEGVANLQRLLFKSFCDVASIAHITYYRIYATISRIISLFKYVNRISVAFNCG